MRSNIDTREPNRNSTQTAITMFYFSQTVKSFLEIEQDHLLIYKSKIYSPFWYPGNMRGGRRGTKLESTHSQFSVAWLMQWEVQQGQDQDATRN